VHRSLCVCNRASIALWLNAAFNFNPHITVARDDLLVDGCDSLLQCS
jgi:2'-5' RNA ligase